jgi:tetratricopeptide (TPR) repeat protein
MKKSASEILKELGFAQTNLEGGEFRYQNTKLEDSQKGEQKAKTAGISLYIPIIPWKVKEWLVVLKNDLAQTQFLEISLDRQVLRQMIIDQIKSTHGTQCVVEFADNNDGSTWCLVEFSQKASSSENLFSNHNTYGFAGFRYFLYPRGSGLGVGITDRFGLGDFPQNFLPTLIAVFRQILSPNGKGEKNIPPLKKLNCFEFIFSPIEIASSLLGSLSNLDSGTQVFANSEANSELGAATPEFSSNAVNFKLHGNWGQSSNSKNIISSFPRLPIEILETRELVASFSLIEQLIIDGQLERARKEVQTALAANPSNLHLLRRFAILELGSSRITVKDLDFTQFGAEPQNILFLSFEVMFHLSRSKPNQALPIISKLGEILYQKIVGADDLHSFSYVLPNLLGDCWFVENPGIAKACFVRIIEKRGELPVILDKLARLSKSVNDFGSETQFLERLAASESNYKVAANIFYRLLLVKSKDPKEHEEAIQNGRECLKRDPKNVDAALITADLIVSKDAAEHALEILDATLEAAIQAQSPATDISKVESRIGKIWQDEFKRADLARNHFEKAVKYDPKNLETLSILEKILRQQKDHNGLVNVLNAQYTAMQGTADETDLQGLKKEIVNIYSDELGQIDKAIDLYMNIRDGASLEPEEIVKMMKWDESKVDWRKLYHSLLRNIQKMKPGKQSADLNISLANLARNKLKDNQKATDHLLLAMRHAQLDDTLFKYLVEQLMRLKDYSKLAECLKTRVDQVGTASKSPLIKQILALPEGVQDRDKDRLAIMLIQLDPEDRKELFKRFNEYKAEENLANLESLSDTVLGDTGIGVNQDFWLELIVENISSLKTHRRFDTLDRFLRKRIELSGNATLVIESAIAMLSKSNEPEKLKYYVGLLLNQGVLPKLEVKLMTKILEENSAAAGKLYFLDSQREKDTGTAAALAKKAATIFQRFPSEKAYEEKALTHYCSLILSSPEDIARLRNLVADSDNWMMFIRALQKQADLTPKVEWKNALLEEIGQIYRDRLNNPRKSLEAFERASKFSEQPETLKLQMANLVHDIGETEREKQLLLECLDDSKFIQNLDAVGQVVDRLRISYNENAAIERILSEHVRTFSDNGMKQQALAIGDILVERNMGSRDIKNKSFVSAITDGNQMKVRERWLSLMADLRDTKDVDEFLRKSKKVLDDQDSSIIWEDLIVDAIDNERFLKIAPKIQQELKLHLGLILFSSDDHADKAIELLTDVKRDNPDEIRVLMPLYLLIREFGQDEQVARYLSELIPLANENPGLIKNYPVTLESLKVEFQRIKTAFENNPSARLKSAAGFSSGGSVNQRGSSHNSTNQDKNDFKPQNAETLRVIKKTEQASSSNDSDWRDLVNNLSFSPGITPTIFDKPFSSALEKHIALQAVALLSGELKFLSNWQWQVWRNKDNYVYPLSGKSRYPEEIEQEILNSPLARLITTLTPIFSNIYRDQFTVKYLSQKLKIQPKDFSKRVKPLSWESAVLKNTALDLFDQSLQRKQLQIFDLKGMQSEIFFDIGSKYVFFDSDFYAPLPPSILFHRLFNLIWSIKQNYYVPLRLNPGSQILPLLSHIFDAASDNSISRIKNLFGMEQNAIAKLLNNLDKSEIKRLFERVGALKEDQLRKLWRAMTEHVYRIQIVETLDIIGVFEAIAGKDLLNDKKLTGKKIMELSPSFVELLKFIATLKV